MAQPMTARQVCTAVVDAVQRSDVTRSQEEILLGFFIEAIGAS